MEVVTVKAREEEEEQRSHAQQYPWLLIQDKSKGLKSYWLFSMSDKSCHSLTTIHGVDLCNKYVMSCSDANRGREHRWLLVMDMDSDKSSLLDLVSGQNTQLPDSLSAANFNELIVTASPSTGEFQSALFLSPFTENSRTILSYKSGDEELTKVEIDENVPNPRVFVGLGGKLYCLSTTGGNYKLGMLDFTTGFTLLIDSNPIDPRELHSSRCYLIESNRGELLLVEQLFFGYHGSRVLGFQIFRADFVKREWVEVENLGEGEALFVDHHHCLFWSSSATSEGSTIKGNSIYFTNLDDRCLYVFDLLSQRVSGSLPCSGLRNRSPELFWITMPKKC